MVIPINWRRPIQVLLFCLFTSLTLIIFGGACHAQSYTVTRYADDSGLPSRIIRDVVQDKNGYIWVAGNNGLYRFDGQEFRPYLSSLKDTMGLRDNKITALTESENGKLWIGTPKGLHLLQDNTIRHIPIVDNPSDNQQYIINVFEDSVKNLWVATYGGLFLLESNNEVIHFLSEDKRALELSSGTVWAVTEDIEGRIWVATNDGFFRIGAQDEYAIEKVDLVVSSSLESKDIGYYKIQQYSNELFIIDSSHGLLKGSLFENTVRIAPFLNEKGETVDQFSVERSIVDENGSVWLGTWKNGLKKAKIIDGRLVQEKILAVNGFKEMSATSHSIFEDSQNNIWAANTNGLYKFSIDDRVITTFPPFGCSFELKGIYGMLEDKGQNLWITTPTTLYRFKKSDLLRNNCPTEYLSFSDENMQLARYLFIDGTNRLWIGADNGLFVTQLDTEYNPGKFKRFTINDGLPHNNTNEIYEVAKDSFWIGNYSGLVQLNLQAGTLNNPEIKVYTADKSEQNRLVNSFTYMFEKDGMNNLWIGTFSGVSMLLDSSGEGSFKNYTSQYGNHSRISNNSIKKIFRDNKNRLWIATQRGLNLYQPEKDTFLQFGHAEGMPSEYILGINEDSKENLWICTTNGVLKAKFDQETLGFSQSEHYTVNDGLADNIPYRNSILIDNDDNVFIGSRDGISVFRDYEQSDTEKSDFTLAITEIESTQKKDVGFSSVLGRLENDELILSYKTNSVKLKYVMLDFKNPESNRYRHKFLPASDNWIDTETDSELAYYNLSPGEYELVLDGSDSGGNWSDNPIKLKLKVLPPFWKSNWAYLTYLLLIVALLRFLYLIRIRKKVKELEHETLLEKALVQEREQLRQENAADFHDELGSMVTKISMFLTMAERSWQNSEDPSPFFGKIRNNVKGLSTGFRDLLWVIDPQKDSLADTYIRLKEFGEDLFEQSNINFRTSKFQEAFTELALSAKTKKQLIMIFKEAMTNCLKYSNGKRAELIVTTNGQFSKMEFIDDGEGFDVKIKSKGRGLKNMIARAEKISADFSIASNKNGTAVRLHRILHLGDKFSLQDE